MVVADVDGTLLTDDKRLTASTIGAVNQLRSRDIWFTLASARPPMGLRFQMMQLGVDSPVAALNGAMIVDPKPGLRALSVSDIGRPVGNLVGGIMDVCGLDSWAYCGLDWFVPDFKGERVEWEAECASMKPRLFSSWGDLPSRPSKIVGVSDVPERMADAERIVHEQLRTAVNAACSTPFYLDITPPGADKGTAVEWLAVRHGVELSEVAVIGDGEVDTAMFLAARGGLSIAMGNAPDSVKWLADVVTTTNEGDGFATAMREHVL